MHHKDPAARKAYQAEYARRNRDRFRDRRRELQRRRFAEKKGEIREKAKAWRHKNKDKCRAHWAKRTTESKTAAHTKWVAKNRGKFMQLVRKYGGLPEPTCPQPAFCEVCGKPPKKHCLCLDHDHKTGAFRGWLCMKCNTGIGKLGDDSAGLRRALLYLEAAEAAPKDGS